MTRLMSAFTLLIALCVFVPAASAQQPYTPARGTAERAAILNSLRPAIEAQLNPPVEFVVRNMSVANGWAFVTVDPQRPGGGKIAFSTTRITDTSFYDGLTTYALLKFQTGNWHVIDKVIGPTDVAWEGWAQAYGAPRAIFGY